MIFTLRRLTALALFFLAAFSLSAVEISGDAVVDGKLVIPTASLSEQAKFFAITVDGTKMEVFAVKAADGSIRTAFNTCQVCYNSGRGWYVQDGNVMVCQNCGSRFRIDQVEVVKGGCNPVPITSEFKVQKNGSIIISGEFLAQYKSFFKRWKRLG